MSNLKQATEQPITQINPGTKLLPVAEVVKQFPFSVSTLSRLRADGTGPRFVEIRGRYFYPEEWFLHWLQERSALSVTEIDTSRHERRRENLISARAAKTKDAPHPLNF